MRPRADLFVASVLVLVLELACIRWFPAHVLFLTFFTNVMLLASFLGISVGCLAANRPRNYLAWTPLLLIVALAVALGIDWERQATGTIVAVGSRASPQLVFFGVEYQPSNASTFVIPIEAVCGLLFVMVAVALVGPGQELGRALGRLENRIEAYTINIAGSIFGILLFTVCSWRRLGPGWWFALVLATVWYLRMPGTVARRTAFAIASAAVILLAAALPVRQADQRELWSPYYRINYETASRIITVNLIGHQQMISRNTASPAYALPHLLNRDSGQRPFGDVLVIGAGSGNDVSRALAWGATHVDAVEIDPEIYALGRRHHPDRPYFDPRVSVHLDDGRNFLRSTTKKYDLVVYALVDSLVLHSGYSNIRLESYLFTTEAFADIRRRLKPGGLFVMYNYFRQGWIVGRLEAMLESTFGTGNPIVFNLPARATVRPEDVMYDEFTLMFAGATAPIKERFAGGSAYLVSNREPSSPALPNGFTMARPTEARDWLSFQPTEVVPPTDGIVLATDSWPFLYLRRPMLPSLSLRGIAIMGVLGAAFLVPFLRRTPLATRVAGQGEASSSWLLAQMFFLGAGFMLIETKAVVHMALLFGSTWIVNSIVFCAVLSMILLANLFVLGTRPRSLLPYYLGLIATLTANAAVPLDAFLGLSRTVQILGSCALAFTPVLFAGVIFAVSFSRASNPDRAFGANIAGAMLGGLAENLSMLVGFQYVILVAVAFYAMSWISAVRDSPRGLRHDPRPDLGSAAV